MNILQTNGDNIYGSPCNNGNNFMLNNYKSQGQTLQHVGVFLPTHVFSHGQLYVALTRAGNSNNVSMYIVKIKNQYYFDDDGICTKNIVYHEVLNSWTLNVCVIWLGYFYFICCVLSKLFAFITNKFVLLCVT